MKKKLQIAVDRRQKAVARSSAETVGDSQQGETNSSATGETRQQIEGVYMSRKMVEAGQKAKKKDGRGRPKGSNRERGNRKAVQVWLKPSSIKKAKFVCLKKNLHLKDYFEDVLEEDLAKYSDSALD